LQLAQLLELLAQMLLLSAMPAADGSAFGDICMMHQAIYVYV